jgi:hypothetical protein
MSRKKYLIVSIIVFFHFLISTSVGFAIGDDKNSRSSLRGLKKLSVVVQIEKPALDDFKKVGLTEDRIRASVALKLQEAKIDVVYAEDPAADTPILHVDLNGSNRNGKTFSFLIEIELWQKSILKRDPKVEGITGTWSKGVFGSGPPSNIGNDIMGLIDSTMDAFVKAYLSVNS